MRALLRLRLAGLAPNKGQHLLQCVLVVNPLDMLPHDLHQASDDHRPSGLVSLKAVALPDTVSIAVLRLPHKLAGVPQPLQLPDRVRAEVGLYTNKGYIVIPAQTVQLLCKHILVHLAPDGTHLLAGDMVYHLPNVIVGALASSIAADDISATLDYISVYLDWPVALNPSNRRIVYHDLVRPLAVPGAEHKLSLHHGGGNLLQPLGDLARVKDRLA